jgi:hypothetical protein
MLAVSLFAGCASTPEEGEPNATTPPEEGEMEAAAPPVEEGEPTTGPATSASTAGSGPVPTNPCVECGCPYILDDRNYTQEHVFDNTREYRYMEVFITCPGAGTGIYNTMALNIQPDNSRDSAPEDLMANYSDEQVREDYNATKVYMSGIRHWTHDKMRVTLSNNVRNLNGLDTRWGADAAVDEVDMSKGEQFYTAIPVTCNRTWYYEKGKPVFILDAPNNMTFIMQSYALIVDPDQTYEDLNTLGERLNLPEGWSYRVEVLDQDLEINGITADGKDNQWRVTQDDLVNTYSACWESDGQSSCNYRP